MRWGVVTSLEGIYAPEANVIWKVYRTRSNSVSLDWKLRDFLGLGLNVTNVILGFPSHLGFSYLPSGQKRR